MNQRLAVEVLVLVSLITSIVTASEENSWFGSEFSVLQKLYDDCQDKNDFSGCLKGKAITALSRADDKVLLKKSVNYTKKIYLNIYLGIICTTRRYSIS